MNLTRRRFLLAATAAAAFGRVTPVRWEWRGSALGAEARIVLAAPRDQAEAALAGVVAEIDRLEDIFSLHRPGSQLSRLNADGRLDAPARDLREALAASARWTKATEGAFDPAVQPLWRHWARGEGAPDAALARVRAARIDATPARVVLSPGTALTLNGIAQGIVADRVAALLARHGFAAPVIDTGEMRLAGPGRQTIDLPAAGLRLRLAEVAVATSAPSALTFDAAGRRHHLFDPLTGDSPGRWRGVTVLAPTAEAADALSTAFAVAPPELAGDLAASLPDVAAIATDRAGRVQLFGAARLLREALG
jgi:thiamine biosynthesis lipoprotein